MVFTPATRGTMPASASVERLATTIFHISHAPSSRTAISDLAFQGVITFLSCRLQSMSDPAFTLAIQPLRTGVKLVIDDSYEFAEIIALIIRDLNNPKTTMHGIIDELLRRIDVPAFTFGRRNLAAQNLLQQAIFALIRCCTGLFTISLVGNLLHLQIKSFSPGLASLPPQNITQTTQALAPMLRNLEVTRTLHIFRFPSVYASHLGIEDPDLVDLYILSP